MGRASAKRPGVVFPEWVGVVNTPINALKCSSGSSQRPRAFLLAAYVSFRAETNGKASIGRRIEAFSVGYTQRVKRRPLVAGL
jgi:hypothetical protein